MWDKMKWSEKSNCRLFFRKKWNFHKIPSFLPKMVKIFELQEGAIICRKRFLEIATKSKKYWQRAKSSRNLNLTFLRAYEQTFWNGAFSISKHRFFLSKRFGFCWFFHKSKGVFSKEDLTMYPRVSKGALNM